MPRSTFRLGLFVIVAVLLFATGIFLIGNRRLMFARSYHLTTQVETVAGLMDGAEVRVGGINHGTVSRIDLPAQPGGLMTVHLKMDRSTREVVRADSMASIESDGMFGDKHVEVTFGSPDATRLEDNAEIASARAPDFADLTKSAGAAMEDMQAVAAQLKDIGAKISAGQGTVGALVNDKALYNQLQQTTVQAQAAATGFKENMDALRHNFLLRGFFSKRAYDDPARLTADEVEKLPSGAPVRQFSFDAAKLFDTDSAKLKQAKALDEAGRALESEPFGLAVIVARNTMKGDSDEVKTLTQARAMNVRDYLVGHFKMDDTRLKTRGAGKDPGAGDGDKVEILIYASGK
jgi:phospholipid/cholesterol/gamma-HCH transport system substrate-binding protein